MGKLRRSVLVSLLAIALLALFMGCEGDQGPAGPAGLKGDKGDPGDPGDPGPGTRTFVKDEVPSDENPYEVSIPGLSLSDPPLVSVFIEIIPESDEWDEMPVSWEVEDNGQFVEVVSYASMIEGGVLLYNCAGLEYILIIIE